MKNALAILLLVLSGAPAAPPTPKEQRAGEAAGAPLRKTNSYAANRRGVAAFEKKEYAKAAAAFKESHDIAATPENAFNLGTAEVAAGKREDGSETLSAAMKDPRLRADALYNRGTSALASNAFDHAIRDYAGALRLRPNDAAAKRNLEIALLRKQEIERQRSQQRQGKGGENDEKKEPSESEGDEEQQRQQGKPDAESILRSVQQQEREELQRMRRQRAAGPRVGW